MTEQPANVRLSLAATAESVVLVRGLLSGIAQSAGLGASDLSDIQTAVTEACNNVVIHAYDGGEGPLEVEVGLVEQELFVKVRDHGLGIRLREGVGEDEEGIGLHVIRTLSRTVEFELPDDGGSEVCMRFDAPGASALGEGVAGETRFPDSQTSVSVTPAGLAGALLPRLVSSLAARAHFTTDRLSDIQLLVDALLAHAGPLLSEDRIDLAVDVEPRALELHLGPLRAGGARSLIGDSELDGVGGIIEKLTDGMRVASDGECETLTVDVADAR